MDVVCINIGWNFCSEQGPQRNSHTSLIWRDKLFILGGYDSKGITSNALTFNLGQRIWNKIPMKGADHKTNPARYAHKTAIIEREVYVFGGYVEEQGWLNDLCKISLDTHVRNVNKIG